MEVQSGVLEFYTYYSYFYNQTAGQTILNGGDINMLNGPDETLICGLMMGADGGLKLRAERSGTGSGRIYTIRLLCEHPDSGIGDETTVVVVVPHDRGGS